MSTKSKYLIGVILMGLMDIIIPLPLLGIILLYVILQRPSWFRDAIREIYEKG